MTQDEAARNTDPTGAGDGGARAAGPAPGSAQPGASRDERPRPQYGEYAPEGWAWKPPADSPRTVESAPEAHATAPAFAPPPGAATSAAARPVRPVDRLATIMLLVIGLLGMWGAIGTLQSLPEQLPVAIRSASDMLGTNLSGFEYTPGPEVPGILLAGSIAQIVLWVLTAWWSIARLRARRLAFWVPLAAGVVSIVLLYAAMFIVVLSDPALVAAITPS